MAVNIDLPCHAFRHGVGGHDGVRGIEPSTGREIGHALRQSGEDAVHGQMFEDDAGGKRQHL